MSRLRLPVRLPVKGLDVSKPAEYIDFTGSPSVQNIEVNREVIRKRLGTGALGSSMGERIMAFSELQIGSATSLLRFGMAGIELYDKVAGTWSSVAGSALTGTANDLFDFAFPILSGSKIMTFTNGVDAIRKYTGSGNTAALGGTPPKAKYMIAFGDYLILANITDGGNTFRSRVKWPDTGLPETWSGGNAGNTDLVEDGQDITGLGLFGSYFTVHKQGAIYLGYPVTTSDVFRFDRKNTGIGASAHQTIRSLPTGEQIFLAMDGLHLFNGNTAPLVESPIMDELRESLSPTYISRSCAIVVRELDEVWFAVPIGSQTNPETIYKYNYRTGRCWRDSRTNLTFMSTYIKTTDETWDSASGTWDSETIRWDDVTSLALNPTPIFGDSTGVSTERTTSANDNGTAIDARFETKDFTAEDFGGELGQIVRFQGMQVWAKGNGVDLEYSVDSGTTWTGIGTLTLASDYAEDGSPSMSYFDVTNTKVRFRFSNDTAGESFTLKKFYLEAILREQRR